MTFPAHIIHAPQASRTGGRRTLRHHMEPWTSRGERRALGRPGRSLKIFVEATLDTMTEAFEAMGRVL